MIFIIVVLIALLALQVTPRWRHDPCVIWTISWLVFWCCYWALGQDYYSSRSAIFVVFLGNVAFILGAVLLTLLRTQAGGLRHRAPNITPHRNFVIFLAGDKNFNRVISLALIVAVILLAMGLRQISGTDLALLASMGRQELFQTMRSNQATLYLSEDNFPLAIKLCTALLCTSSLLIGSELASPRGTKNWLVAVNLAACTLLSLGLAIGTGIRTMLLIPLLSGSFAFYASTILTGQTARLLSTRAVLGFVILLFGFLGWVVLVQSARLSGNQPSETQQTLEHLRPWFAGYIPAFSIWYDGFADREFLLGKMLLRGILGPLGLASGEGFDARLGAVNIGHGQFSNAMTVFRVLVADFGSGGAIIACGFFGFGSTLLYEKAVKNGGASIILLSAVYCAVFFSVNYWFFGYGARIAGFALAWVLVHFQHRLFLVKNEYAIEGNKRVRTQPVTPGARLGVRQSFRQHK